MLPNATSQSSYSGPIYASVLCDSPENMSRGISDRDDFMLPYRYRRYHYNGRAYEFCPRQQAHSCTTCGVKSVSPRQTCSGCSICLAAYAASTGSTQSADATVPITTAPAPVTLSNPLVPPNTPRVLNRTEVYGSFCRRGTAPCECAICIRYPQVQRRRGQTSLYIHMPPEPESKSHRTVPSKGRSSRRAYDDIPSLDLEHDFDETYCPDCPLGKEGAVCNRCWSTCRGPNAEPMKARASLVDAVQKALISLKPASLTRKVHWNWKRSRSRREEKKPVQPITWSRNSGTSTVTEVSCWHEFLRFLRCVLGPGFLYFLRLASSY